MEKSLRVYKNGTVIFESDRNWLYPLFDLKRLLDTQIHDPGELYLQDKVVGRAAALMIVHLGIKQLDAGILSELAIEVLERHSMDYTYDTLVEKIQCKTEEILKEEFDPERAYRVLAERAAGAAQ
jgi:zinc transport system ATP-binding protein